jgi:hypothetical protein
MFGIFGLVIASFSILFSRAYGLLGLLLPPALVGFAYLLVETFLVELYWWHHDRDKL